VRVLAMRLLPLLLLLLGLACALLQKCVETHEPVGPAAGEKGEGGQGGGQGGGSGVSVAAAARKLGRALRRARSAHRAATGHHLVAPLT
jgi:hypothetical protein